MGCTPLVIAFFVLLLLGVIAIFGSMLYMTWSAWNDDDPS